MAHVVQGLVTKSVDTGNAWSLIVQSGRLRGFYYRSFGNFAMDALRRLRWRTAAGIMPR